MFVTITIKYFQLHHNETNSVTPVDEYTRKTTVSTAVFQVYME